MSIFRRFLPFAAAAALVPSLAMAQKPNEGSIVYVGDESANGVIKVGNASYNVGPYLANLSGFNDNLGPATTSPNALFANVNNAIIWCVDWAHVAPDKTVGDTYFASPIFGSVKDMSDTRDFATYAHGTVSEIASANANALLKYTKAAWFAEQLGTSSVYTAANIQGTLWQLFNNTAPGIGSSNADDYTTQLTAPVTLTLARDWYVLSDCISGTGCVSNQEFMYSRPRMLTAPEPSTYVLMSAGLAGLGLLSRRRRRRSNEGTPV